MGNYRITYEDFGGNPRTIDLLPGDDGVQVEWDTKLNRNITSTGRYETIVQHTARLVTFDVYFDEDTKHKMETFMSFAQQGKPFTFTKDLNKGTQHALLSDLTVADTAVFTKTAVSFDVNDWTIIKGSQDTHWDLIKVCDITLPDEITACDPIQNDYLEDDIISWYYYFNSLLLLDTDFRPTRDGDFYHHEFACVEV